jgi:hypothetical protein
MLIERSSAARGERDQNALPMLRPLLKRVHELSTDSGTPEGFAHEQFIDPGSRPARVKRDMAVPGHVADQPSLVLRHEQTGEWIRQFRVQRPGELFCARWGRRGKGTNELEQRTGVRCGCGSNRRHDLNSASASVPPQVRTASHLIDVAGSSDRGGLVRRDTIG